ncbi:MAG: hypothetical protein R3344_13380 [Acidobacteriota bacterium]|nr:hypothetical protein [Acidobacteriota bacterium]
MLAVSGVDPSWAQEDPDEVPEFDPVNAAFSSYIGGGIYYIHGRTVWIVRFPASFGIRDEDEKPFGIRFRLTTNLGFFDFKPNDVIEGIVPEKVGSASLLPGVGFPINVTRSWQLEPFLDLGAGWNSEESGAIPILGAGAYSRAEFKTRKSKIILWNRLVYARAFTIDQEPAPDDDFILFETTPEYRLPFAQIKKHGIDTGVYVSNEAYIGRVFVRRPDGTTVDLRWRWEVGFTFGTVEETRFWKIKVPRLGLGYRWGDLGEGIRFLFTFRY